MSTTQLALCFCPIRQVIAACSGAYDAGPEASHRVIHQDGDRTTFRMSGYCFATSKVASLFFRQVNERGDLARLVQILSASPGSDAGLRGLLFEAYAHNKLLQGGPFEFKYLDCPGGGAPVAAPAAVPVQLNLPDFEQEVFFSPGSRSRTGARAQLTTDIASFRKAVQSVKPSVKSAYLRPSGQGHPLVDSCIYPDSLIQMTVADTKPKVDEELLEQHLECLPDLPVYFLDYVVPQDVYSTFRVPTLKRDRSLTPRVQRIRVRVVKVVTTATSLRLQRSRVTLHPRMLPTQAGPMGSRFRAVV